MYAGVVPQHPPTILTRPSIANYFIFSPKFSGVSSYPPIAFGSPAFGYACTYVLAILLSLYKKGIIYVAPNAQLKPMQNALAFIMLI